MTNFVFVGAYKKSIERSNKKTPTTSIVEEQPSVGDPVKFYNWLEVIEERTVMESKPNIDNWLLW
ncbi:hypothetical protein [Psychrobacillus sp.]|uniref:hypothetical protein n=1 Tax=Psychrobacillus sp. TaxID=1871623 RepID=UPI0028BD4CAC|nr:hypothetical protein [Psychrobacillus sp.]